MAKTNIKAPVGHHFMVKTNGHFYLMKNSAAGYVSHIEGEHTSQLSMAIEVRGTHTPTTTTQRTATATSATGSTTTTRTTSSTRGTTSSGGGSSSGGY